MQLFVVELVEGVIISDLLPGPGFLLQTSHTRAHELITILLMTSKGPMTLHNYFHYLIAEIGNFNLVHSQ